MTTYRKKTKKRLKRKFYLPLFLIIFLIAGYFGYNQYLNFQVTKLGYQTVALKPFKKLQLRQTIIKKGEYSKALEKAVLNKNYQKELFNLYFIKEEITEAEIILYKKLSDLKQYLETELNHLFSELDYRELTPLLVFEKLEDIEVYIDDVKENRYRNENSFYLTNDYLNKYHNPSLIDTDLDILMLVNDKNQLPEDYLISDLVMIPNECRLKEMTLRAEAQKAFVSLCHDIESAGYKIASKSAYRSYQDQANIYQDNVAKYGVTTAEEIATRPGFSEHQTGLGVDIASLSSSENQNFSESATVRWLNENIHHYGFIFRYPKGYESITGISQDLWHLRYIGVEAATKFQTLDLTFDEYFYLEILK